MLFCVSIFRKMKTKIAPPSCSEWRNHHLHRFETFPPFIAKSRSLCAGFETLLRRHHPTLRELDIRRRLRRRVKTAVRVVARTTPFLLHSRGVRRGVVDELVNCCCVKLRSFPRGGRHTRRSRRRTGKSQG